MKGMRRAERVYLCLSLPLIIATALLIHGTPALAQELNPVQSVTLLQGQSASIGLSQTTPFGFNTVAVTSIGNTSFTATLGSISADGNLPFPTGLHITTAFGTGGRTFFDIKFGVVPWGGVAATIDIGTPVSFCIATTSVWVLSDIEPSESNPVRYNLTVR